MIDVVIPVLNEEACIGGVVAEFLPAAGVRRVLVVDNGSTDASAERARAAGAVVVAEPRRGYGAACLRGLEALRADPPQIVVFADGDGSADPADLPALTAPIVQGEGEGRADLVIGSRALGAREPGAVLPHAAFGNWVACTAMRLRFGVRYTDLGPFRAIRWEALDRLGMTDRGYGWTVEMQIRAAASHLRVTEAAAHARPRRAGRSKVAGSVRGTLGATGKILWVLARHLARPAPTRF